MATPSTSSFDYQLTEQHIRSVSFLLRIIETVQSPKRTDPGSLVPFRAQSKHGVSAAETEASKSTRGGKLRRWLRLLDHLALLLVRTNGEVVTTGASELSGRDRYVFFAENPKGSCAQPRKLAMLDCEASFAGREEWRTKMSKGSAMAQHASQLMWFLTLFQVPGDLYSDIRRLRNLGSYIGWQCHSKISSRLHLRICAGGKGKAVTFLEVLSGLDVEELRSAPLPSDPPMPATKEAVDENVLAELAKKWDLGPVNFVEVVEQETGRRRKQMVYTPDTAARFHMILVKVLHSIDECLKSFRAARKGGQSEEEEKKTHGNGGQFAAYLNCIHELVSMRTLWRHLHHPVVMRTIVKTIGETTQTDEENIGPDPDTPDVDYISLPSDALAFAFTDWPQLITRWLSTLGVYHAAMVRLQDFSRSRWASPRSTPTSSPDKAKDNWPEPSQIKIYQVTLPPPQNNGQASLESTLSNILTRSSAFPQDMTPNDLCKYLMEWAKFRTEEFPNNPHLKRLNSKEALAAWGTTFEGTTHCESAVGALIMMAKAGTLKTKIQDVRGVNKLCKVLEGAAGPLGASKQSCPTCVMFLEELSSYYTEQRPDAQQVFLTHPQPEVTGLTTQTTVETTSCHGATYGWVLPETYVPPTVATNLLQNLEARLERAMLDVIFYVEAERNTRSRMKARGWEQDSDSDSIISGGSGEKQLITATLMMTVTELDEVE